MPRSQLIAICKRLLSDDNSSLVTEDEWAVAVHELPPLIVSRTMLGDFLQLVFAGTSLQQYYRTLDDTMVQQVLERGLESLSERELAGLLVSPPDLVHLNEQVYRASPDIQRAQVWCDARLAEGERLIEMSGDRTFHERFVRSLKRH